MIFEISYQNLIFVKLLFLFFVCSIPLALNLPNEPTSKWNHLLKMCHGFGNIWTSWCLEKSKWHLKQKKRTWTNDYLSICIICFHNSHQRKSHKVKFIWIKAGALVSFIIEWHIVWWSMLLQLRGQYYRFYFQPKIFT